MPTRSETCGLIGIDGSLGYLVQSMESVSPVHGMEDTINDLALNPYLLISWFSVR